MVDSEVLDALADELEELRPDLEGELEVLLSAGRSREEVASSTANYVELISRLAQAAETGESLMAVWGTLAQQIPL